jgi:hypothetical protein
MSGGAAAVSAAQARARAADEAHRLARLAYETEPSTATLEALGVAKKARDAAEADEVKARAALPVEAEARLAAVAERRKLAPLASEELLESTTAAALALAHAVKVWIAALAQNAALDAAEIEDRRFLCLQSQAQAGNPNAQWYADQEAHTVQVEAHARRREALASFRRAFRAGLDEAGLDERALGRLVVDLLPHLNTAAKGTDTEPTAKDRARARPGAIGRWAPRVANAMYSLIRGGDRASAAGPR